MEWFHDVLDTVHSSWVPLFSSVKMKEELADIEKRLNRCIGEGKVIYPKRENILRLFSLVPLEDIKCVIIGQDPYASGDATGVAFSGGRNTNIPASLANIWKEVTRCYPRTQPLSSPSLEGWCEQGVFLLNRALTVVEGKPGAHLGIWSGAISLVVNAIADYNANIPWLLWGREAKKISDRLDQKQCTHVLVCGHPSPFSVKLFMGNGHFLEVNKYLEADGDEPIDWSRASPIENDST